MRQDISLAQQVVQSNHATYMMAATFQEELPFEIPNIVLIGVPDQSSLNNVMESLIQKGIRFVDYCEPDFGMGLSAIATIPLGPVQRALLSEYSTWKPSSIESVSRNSSDVERSTLNGQVGDSIPSCGVAGVAQ